MMEPRQNSVVRDYDCSAESAARAHGAWKARGVRILPILSAIATSISGLGWADQGRALFRTASQAARRQAPALS